MNNCIRLPITIAFIVALFLSVPVAGWQPRSVQAQAENESALTIAGVDTSQFPTLQLTLDGATWPEERAAAPLQVLINNVEQHVQADETRQQGIGFMVAIDPNNLATTEAAGQNRYVQLTGALLDLVENEILLRNQDWLAAYLLAPQGIQSIQAWTQEPNLVFNSIVQNRPAEVTNTPLTAETLINTLQQFTTGPAAATTARSLLLISTGSDTLTVAPVVAAAQALAVRIHVIALVNGDSNAATNTPLAELAQQTGGDYVTLTNPGVLPPLWARLAADHNQRVLTLQSTETTPQTLQVRLALPNGSTLSATADPAIFLNLPAAPVAAAPAAQTVLTRSETQAPVANALPANTQSAAAQPVLAAPPANGAETTAPPAPSTVVVPGLQLALPRSLLQLSLPILFLLIGYFVYAEMRERRQRNGRRKVPPTHAVQQTEVADPLFALGDHSQPLGASRFDLREQQNSGGSGFTIEPKSSGGSGFTMETPGRVAPPSAKVTPPSARPPVRPPARQSNLFQEEDENEATIRPSRMEDEEATYRAQDVEQPIIGYLVRANSDPNLPKELPIYGLSPAPGEVRQIHIGRHSKHNTVVINDKSISREHAVIIQRAGRLYLRDNGSTSGTFLNWKRLSAGEELLLRHNDLISFGQIVYEFRLHGEDEVTLAES